MNIMEIIGAIFAIFSIIIIHEMGHFYVARCFGIKILRFSIGFGKPLLKRVSKKTGTEYVLGWLPLGGYVKMLGEGDQETSPEDLPHAYNKQPLLVRMAVVSAGPIVNFLLAILVFWAVYLLGQTQIKPIIGQVQPQSIAALGGMRKGDEIIAIDNKPTQNWRKVMMAIVSHAGDQTPVTVTVRPMGSKTTEKRSLNLSAWQMNRSQPDFFNSLGMAPFRPKILPKIAQVMPGSAAKKGGMLAGDEITAINGKAVRNWSEVVAVIRHLPGKTAQLMIKRNGKTETLSLVVGEKKIQGKSYGYLGVMVQAPVLPASMMYKQKFGVGGAFVEASKRTWQLLKFNAIVIVKMLSGKLSAQSLGGPISIFQAAGKASTAGIQIYLGFIAFISLTIGFINILPIPGLDGGHLFFQIIEGVFRRPVSERVQMVALSFGLVGIVTLVLYATMNDLLRIFG